MTIKTNVRSNYTGAEESFRRVRQQIIDRWGQAEAENYDPYSNALTYRQWSEAGYHVRAGEHALHSIVICERKGRDGQTSYYPRPVALFYYKQVDSND